MALGDTSKLIASLTLEDKFTPTVQKALGGMGKLEGGMRRMSLVAGAIGGVLGAGFAIAAKGAAELDTATRQFQADTGATAEEAAKASDAIASMYRGNLQGFEQIGATLGKVTTDLGLTGKAAEETTALFLNFATATGIDSAQGVSLADDALDAWNMTASDAAPLLDKLVASHQKYGGSISENFDALARLAPSVQALGGNIDDAIGLLNLFEASGLDSGKAMAALNIAVKKLQPGQTINDLVAQVASIEDPTLRAQKAIEIFGARGGVGLANALRPGIDSLQDFVPAAEDVAGATKEAADAVKSGFGAQFQLIIKNAGGALAEFGTNFGPLLLVAGTFGPRMAAGIAAGFGGVAALVGPKLVASLSSVMAAVGAASGTTLGTATGGTFATAMAAATALAIPALVAAAIAAIGVGIALGINQIAPDLARQMNEGFFSGLKAFGRFTRDPFGNWMVEVIPVAEEAGADLADATTTGLRYGLLEGSDEVRRAAATTISEAVKAGTAATRSAGYAAGASVAQGIADGITSARVKPLDAFGALIAALKNPLSKTQEFARLAGQLTSKELAAGLRSYDPAIRAQAEAVRDLILERMEGMKPGAGIIGTKAAAALAAGLKSNDPLVRANAEALRDIITGALKPVVPAAQSAGEKAGTAFGTGFLDKVKAALAQAAGITARFGGGVHVTIESGSVADIGRRAATGGIFSSPTLALIGEAGPEAVVPLRGNPVANLARVMRVPAMADGGVVSRSPLAAFHLEPYKSAPVRPTTFNFTVQTSISSRQNDHGTRIQRRWGPTPTAANAR